MIIQSSTQGKREIGQEKQTADSKRRASSVAVLCSGARRSPATSGGEDLLVARVVQKPDGDAFSHHSAYAVAVPCRAVPCLSSATKPTTKTTPNKTSDIKVCADLMVICHRKYGSKLW